MAKAQEVEEMKEWQLIYDGNLESATRRIELTKDMNGNGGISYLGNNRIKIYNNGGITRLYAK